MGRQKNRNPRVCLNGIEACIQTIKGSLLSNGFIGNVSIEDSDVLSAHYLDVDRLEEQISFIENYSEIKGKFLEIGSGFGGLVVYLNRKLGEKCAAFGVEPSADAYEGTIKSTKILSRENNIKWRFVSGEGEKIPFKPDTFDIVYSTSVLEHVKKPESVIREAIRVLKPGGLFQFVIPNYGSWWEGHYGILMIPHMPKWAFKIYVRILGREPGYVDTLQFIKRKSLRKILSKVEKNVEIISWGEDVWEERLRSLDFSEWASLGRLKKTLIGMRRMGLIRSIIYLGRKLHWETPFILTIRKK